MTVEELLKFTAFRGANLTVTNADMPELSISFDDEVADIVSVQSETKFIQVGGFAFPKTVLNVQCTVLKERRESDTQPLVHAYWIRGKEYGFRTHNPMWYCSNCGGGIRYDTTLRTYQKQKRPVQEVNCFCRKCGAKMDLEPIYEREEINNENH